MYIVNSYSGSAAGRPASSPFPSLDFSSLKKYIASCLAAAGSRLSHPPTI
jgi:hypothetical protein